MKNGLGSTLWNRRETEYLGHKRTVSDRTTFPAQLWGLKNLQFCYKFLRESSPIGVYNTGNAMNKFRCYRWGIPAKRKVLMSIKSFSSTIFTGIYLFTNVAAVHATESNFWAERRRGIQNKSGSPMFMAGLPSAQSTVGPDFLQQFPSIDRHALAPSLSATVTKSLPSNFTNKNASLLLALSTSYGSIRKISLPSSSQTLPSRTVIHIQDVHQNADAQKNIGQVVQSLVDHDQVGLVALEGAFNPINLSGFRSFSRQDVLKKWADYLLRINRISGPIYSALTGAKAFPQISGIDDPAHYSANVEAYCSSAPRMQEYKDKIAALQSILNNKKATLFNPALLAFDRSVQSYSAGKIGLGEHFKTLADQVPANTLTQGTKDFLKALAMESAINFQQVEKDRTQLVERLVQRLDKKQTDTLIQWSVAYRAGQIRYAEFYKSLKDLCENNGFPLARFPAMNEYIRYVLMADGIDPEQLLTDMTALEKSAYAHLIKTSEEKQLAERSNALTLTGKLVDFSLTPVEYEEYTNAALPDFSKDELSIFENFYKQAHARDQSMTDNLLKSMVANKTDTAVLVTGGFHSPGMAEKLQRAGFTVISFTPKIEKIDTSQGSSYLSVFSQEKTPLEKMFQGQKLFLAQNPSGGLNMAPAELSAGVAATNMRNGASLSDLQSDVHDVLAELTRLGLSAEAISVPKVDMEKSGNQLFVTVEIAQDGNTRKVRYTVTFDEEGGYYKADSVEVLDLNGQIVETARELAPAAAREMIDQVNRLFNRGHSEAIAEIPIMSGLPGMALAEILWVLNLHKERNVNSLDLTARIVKIELLRQLSLIAEAGRWVVNPTIAQKLWGSNFSGISELSHSEGRSAEIAKAVAHYVLNRRRDGSDRPGMLNLDVWSVVFPSLDQSHFRNTVLKKMLPQWLGRVPTEQEIDAVMAKALNRKINPAELLKQNWKQPDLIGEWVQESELGASGKGSSQGNDLPSLEQARQMNFADKMRFIPRVFQEMAKLALSGQWKIRKKPGTPLGQGEAVIDESKRQTWHDIFQKKADDLNLLLKFGLLPVDGENVESWYERVTEKREKIQEEAIDLFKNGDGEAERALSNESRQIQEFIESLLADSYAPDGGFKEQNAQEILLDFYHFESLYSHYWGVVSGSVSVPVRHGSPQTPSDINREFFQRNAGSLKLLLREFLQHEPTKAELEVLRTGALRRNVNPFTLLKEMLTLPHVWEELMVVDAKAKEKPSPAGDPTAINEPTNTPAPLDSHLNVLSIEGGRLLDVSGVPDGDLGVIGDVQGNFNETFQALVKTGFVDADGHWIAGKRVLVFAGDLIDGGDNPWEVLSFLHHLSQQAEKSGGRVIVVRGNHEDLMLGALTGSVAHKVTWLRNHGDDTLRALLGNMSIDTEMLVEMSSENLLDELQRQHSDFNDVISWMKSFPYAVRINREILVVHAAPDPEATRFEDMGKTEKSRHHMMWDRHWTKPDEAKYIQDLAQRKTGWGVNYIVYGHSMENPVNEVDLQGRVDLMRTGVFNVNVLPRKAPLGGAQAVLLVHFQDGRVSDMRARYGENRFDLNTVQFPSDKKPVRNTWFRSDILGYGLFVVVSALLMTVFGIDWGTLSSPLKALLLAAAVPLSMLTTSTLGVAYFVERHKRRTDRKVWALIHGVQEGSAKYNAYMESAERIAAAGRAAAAIGKSATWAEIKEQSRLNIEYFVGLFSHQGRPTQAPLGEKALMDVSTILQTMPDVKKGTFSAADVFGAVTNTGSDLRGIAKNAVQGMSEQTRRRVSTPTGALRWLAEVAHIDTNAVALIPLPSTLLERGDLDQIVDNALVMHKKAVFYVEADANIPSAFMIHLESKDHRADLVRLPVGVKLFDNRELMMAVLEKNSPPNVPHVQPYRPDGYTANEEGVTDKKQFGKNSVLPMSLILMFNRMIELANFIATQA
jgi:hypothetical protein